MNFIASYNYDLNQSFHRSFILYEMKELLQFHYGCLLSRHSTSNDSYQFSCKSNGRDCFHVIFWQTNEQFYKIYELPQHLRAKCVKLGQQKLHLQTKCLIKLRRQQIRQFVEENNLVGVPSSEILVAYSQQWSKKEQIFYRQYLSENKSRMDVKKNWDNILGNIVRKIRQKMRPQIAERAKIEPQNNFGIREKQLNFKIKLNKNQTCQSKINYEIEKSVSDLQQCSIPHQIYMQDFQDSITKRNDMFRPKSIKKRPLTSSKLGSIEFIINSVQRQNFKQFFQNSPLVSTFKFPLLNQ